MPVRFEAPWWRVAFLFAWVGSVFALGAMPGAAWFGAWVAFLIGTSLLSRLAKITRVRDVARTEDGIRIGRLTIPKKEILTATPIAEQGRFFLRIMRSWNRKADVEVATEQEAAALLQELGLDAEHAAASFPVQPMRAHRGPWALLPFALAAFFWMGGATMIGSSYYPIGALVVAVVFLARKRIAQVNLVVGTDGIQLTSALKSAFYKHSAISRVEQEGPHINIHLKSGEKLEYKTSNQRKPKAEEVELARRICERILEAQKAVAPSDESNTTALHRGGRSPREWLDYLRRLGEGAESTFRTAAVSRDALLATLENPEANGLDRLAALISLARNMTVEEVPRVRVAIDACAEKKLAARLRVALEDPNPEALEQALIEAEAEAEPPENAAKKAL